MPFRDKTGRLLEEKDLKVIFDMLNGSLESHLNRMENNKKDYEQDEMESDIKTMDAFIGAYKKAKDNLEEKIRSIANGKQDVSPIEFMTDFFKDVNARALDKCRDILPDSFESYEYVVRAFGDPEIDKAFDSNAILESAPQDTLAGLEKTASSFTLAQKPMPGVKGLEVYNPNSDRVFALNIARAGNSTSLNTSLEELEKSIAEYKDPEKHKELDAQARKRKIQNLEEQRDKKFKGEVGISAGAEIARIKSSELINKEHISGSDIYDAFIELNKAVRVGMNDGGKLRGISVTAGEITGVSTNIAPVDMYRTMETIADYMNQIRQTEDPELQKTQAIQLAAFTYQMTLSEHLFEDGNGRSCRLLADTVLQAFGLPPHTPTLDEMKLCATIGSELDFNKGAEEFMKGVLSSNKALTEYRAKEAKKHPESVQKRPDRLVNDKVDKAVQNEKRGKNIVKEIIENNGASHFRKLLTDAGKAKGTFRDSEQYTNFYSALEATSKLADVIEQCGRTGKTYINLKELGPVNMSFAQQMKMDRNGQISLTDAATLFDKTNRIMKMAAKDYVTYKMKDHTDNPQAEPDKKKLNKDDLRKLEVINSVLDSNAVISAPQEKIPQTVDIKTGPNIS